MSQSQVNSIYQVLSTHFPCYVVTQPTLANRLLWGLGRNEGPVVSCSYPSILYRFCTVNGLSTFRPLLYNLLDLSQSQSFNAPVPHPQEQMSAHPFDQANKYHTLQSSTSLSNKIIWQLVIGFLYIPRVSKFSLVNRAGKFHRAH